MGKRYNKSNDNIHDINKKSLLVKIMIMTADDS